MIGIQAVVVLSAALGATPFDLWQEAHPEQVGAGSLEKSLPFSARTVTYIKTEEPGVSVVVDETGAEIDPSELLLAERALRYRERGTWSDEFFVSMAIKPSDYSTDAAVWARVPPPEDPVRPLEDGQMNWEDEQIGQLRDWTATAVAPLKERLVAVGAEVLYVSEFAPVVFVHAPKSVFEQIKFDALVDTIEIEPKQTGGSQTSAQAGRLTSLYSGGITGLGQSVAILEGERVTFGKTTATQNEWENVFIGTNGPRGIPATRDPNCPSTSGDDPDHANAVAGVASGNFGLGWSGAPNATVYSANSCTYTNANLTTAMDWALTKSRIINQSFGDPAGSRSTPSASEQITDWVVRKLAHTAVKICHNTPNTRVACLSFNTINVGGMLNGGTASWANDREFNGQWINPVQDRELPEVVASAAVLSTIAVNTNSRIAYAGPSGAAGGWFGTSFAAPHVSGLAALLMGSRSFLRYWPEALKATVMAGAVNNIVLTPTGGPTANTNRVPRFVPLNIGSMYRDDLKDGVGATSGAASNRIATSNRGFVDYGYFQISPTYWSGNRMIRQWTFTPTGNRVRVVLTWDSQVNCFNCEGSVARKDELGTDLDLWVFDANGAVVAKSMSFANSYEVIDVPSTGVAMPITAKVFKAGTGLPEYFGVAAYWYTEDATGALPDE